MDWFAPVLTGTALGVAAAVLAPKNPQLAAASIGPKTKNSSSSSLPSQAPMVPHEERREIDNHARRSVADNPKLRKFFGVDADGSECDLPVLDSDQLASRNLAQHPHLRKVLGVDENGENADALDLSALTDDEDDGLLVSVGFKLASGLIIGLGAFYAANLASNGDFGRMVLGMFPVEMDALHLRNYLLKFRTR